MTNHSITNELKSKLDDLLFIEDELEALKLEFAQSQATILDLDKDNNRLREQLERALVDRDKLQAFAVNLTTRLQVISENVGSVIRESGRSAVAEAGRIREQRQERHRLTAEPAPARRVRQTIFDHPPAETDFEPAHQDPTDYAPAALVDRLRTGTRPPTNEYR